MKNRLQVKILIFSILCFLLPTTQIVGQHDDNVAARRVFVSSLDSTATNYLNTNFSGMRTWLEMMRKTIFDSTSYNIYKCLAADLSAMHNLKGNWLDTIKVAHEYLLTGEDDLSRYGQAISYWSIGMMQMQEDSPEAKENFKKSAIIFGRLKNIMARKNAETMLTEALIAEGKYAEANFYARQLLDEATRDGDRKLKFESWLLLMRSYNQLGITEQVEQYIKYIEEDGWYKRSTYGELKYLQIKMNYLLSANSYQEAMSNVERLMILSLFNNIDVVAWRTELIMARLMVATNDIEQAQKFLNNCKKIQKNHDITGGTEFSRAYLPVIEAQLAIIDGDYARARRIIEQAKKPRNMTLLLDFPDTYYSVYEDICIAQKDYARAITVMTEKEEVKKTMWRERSHERTRDLELAYQNDTTIRRQNAVLFEKTETISAMRTQSWLGFIVAFLVITASVLIYIMTMNRRKKQDEKLAVERKELLEKEVERQTLELKNQNDQLNFQNQEVVSSQSYARHIQKSIMPSPKMLDNFDEVQGSFIVYKAADLLSGDFYWFKRTNGGRIIICCADSWGRGVPGAMMTMVGITLMTDTTMNNTNLTAANVMELLDIHLLNIIPDIHTQDGINCSIAIIDSDQRQLNLSIARQNALVSRKGKAPEDKEKFELIKGVNRRVGDVDEPFVSRAFENVYLNYESGDTLYLFTDGATSLFGGKTGKKLKVSGLKDIFNQVEQEPFEKRQNSVTRLLQQWHQNQPENDDITIIGITLN